MADKKNFDVIIVGGSYAGLSAAMALGRSLRDVLIIDSGKPCNRQTPQTHNFITHDGTKPAKITKEAKEQVLQYDTVKFMKGLALTGKKKAKGFSVTTDSSGTFQAKKLIFATGVKDIMPNIEGFSDCWGISVIHCPYCHGYEFKGKRTGIFANGEKAAHFAPLIKNLTETVFILTNGKHQFNNEQLTKFRSNNIQLIETKLSKINHDSGALSEVVFEDGKALKLDACYAAIPFEQHCDIPIDLGCDVSEQGLLQTDMFQKTTVEGVFACGDNSSGLRAVSYAIATGNIAGAIANNELSNQEFN